MTEINNMKEVIEFHREVLRLEAIISDSREKLLSMEQDFPKLFIPYLLNVYETWRPELDEKVMLVDFYQSCCYEYTVRSINGFSVRAQQGEKRVFVNFVLNPDVDDYETATFVLPMWSYNEIKDNFDLQKY